MLAAAPLLMGAPLVAQRSVAQRSIASAMPARDRGSLPDAGDSGASGVAAPPPATIEAALQAALASAGVVFTGEVIAIDRTAGAVTVRWRVDDAVRGVSAGTVYEQKEWAGLWAGGTARYGVGERALVLLHAPSVAGYASPVGDGVIPLRGDAVTGTLDLRWLAQQVAVTDTARTRPMDALQAAGGDFALSDALLKRSAQGASVPHARGMQSLPVQDSAWNGSAGVVLSPPTSTPADDPNAHVDSSMILGMLHAWQRASGAGR